jgi:putative MATE family efflux protein
MAKGGKYQVDMCHGPLLGKIIRFSVPLMFANVLTLLFHAADLIVVGHFASSKAMAAVGAAPAFTTLMLNAFWGIASGINVLVSRYTGAKDGENVSKTVHTAVAVGCIGGIFMALLGLAVTKQVLRWMAVPDAIFDLAAVYMWIWCLGIPFMIFYSFGSAVLRSIGDTKRPLYFMLIAGVVNVLLNLFFVLVCKMDVTGVAIATKLSNVLSAVLVLRALSKSGGDYAVVWSKVRIHWHIFKEMFRIGLPAGVQGMLFSLSNLIIQSTVNSFGWQAIAGNTAALSIEGMAHGAFGAFALAVVSFVGQNHGGKKYKRIVRVVFTCLGCSVVTAVVLTIIGHCFKRSLLGIYNPSPEVIDWGVVRMNYQFSFYVLLAMMEVIAGALRGLGYSFAPTVVTLLGACVFRVLWVFAVFPLHPTLENLMISYPVSWAIVNIVNGLMLFFICRKMLIRASQRKFDKL